MPILNNAKKALRASFRKQKVNNTIRSKAKTAIDAVKANPSQATLKVAYSAIDRAAKKNLFHRNRAARLKSQLARLVKTA